MPKIFQRGKKGIFSIRIYSGGSEKWISLRTPHRREAERRAGKLLYAELPPLLHGVIAKPKTKLADMWEAYLHSPAYKSLKPSTIEERARSWEIFASHMPVHADDITQARIIDYINAVAARSSGSTAAKCKAQMSGVWREVGYKFPGLNNPWLALPKIRDSKAKKHTGSFTDSEVDAILTEAAGMRPSWYQMILVALYTGLRLKDVVHLRHDQLKDGQIELVPAKTEKSGKVVRIPCHPAIRGFFGPGDGFLWPEEVERYKGKTCHTVYFKKMLSRPGIKSHDGERYGFHSLRATFITRLEKAGIDRRRIRAAVGHDSDAQTAQYSDVALTSDDVASLDYVARDRAKP